jgi:hypothetical protein
MEQQEQQELPKFVNIKFTIEEVADRVKSLSESEYLSLYLKVKRGEKEFAEIQELSKLLKPYLESR